MSAGIVWTERESDPNHPGWHDCTYCSVLMCLVYGGYDDFPEGIYTAAEREAFESSDDRADETGASLNDTDVALTRRYGLSMHSLPDTSQATLREWLNKPHLAFAIEGANGNLPDGHHLRRWDPAFTGGHCVCVISRGDGKVRWLDPEAPQGYEGDVVDIDTVVQFAYNPTWVRYIGKAEYSVDMPTFKPAAFDRLINRKAVTGSLSNFRAGPSTVTGRIIRTVAEGHDFYPDIVVHGEKVGDTPDADLWYGGWLHVPSTRRYEFGFMHSACFTRLPDGSGIALTPTEVTSTDTLALQSKVDDLSSSLDAAKQAQTAAEQAAATAEGDAKDVRRKVSRFVDALGDLSKV